MTAPLAARLLFGSVVIVQLSHAAPQNEPRLSHSTEIPSSTRPLAEQQARDWGLEVEEWARYQQLMQGPLGLYSPGLDPLTALGIEARDDDERRRYAERQVMTEAERAGKLLAYQRAYDAAWQQLYPGLQPLPITEPTASQPNTSTDRLVVFVQPDCPACKQRVQQLQADGQRFDLFLVDSAQDDDRLRHWVREAGIAPDKVRSGDITLNHDAGRWRALGLDGELPAVLRSVNGQWQRR